jgi:hypothetical protein
MMHLLYSSPHYNLSPIPAKFFVFDDIDIGKYQQIGEQ